MYFYISFFVFKAFGVSHQGVEKLQPQNETVLIQGILVFPECKVRGFRNVANL